MNPYFYKYIKNTRIHSIIVLLLLANTSYVFADSEKSIQVNIFDSHSQITLETNFIIDSIKQKNIISAIQDKFDIQYDDFESSASIEYGKGNNFVEKSTTVAMSSECQTRITSEYTFTKDTTDMNEIFLEIISSDRLSKNQIAKSLILQSDDPENWSINAITDNKETKIQFVHCGERITEFVSSSNIDEIILKAMKITGLTKSQIIDIWRYDNKDLKEKIEFQTHEELIEGSKQIIKDAENNQEKLEQKILDTQTGKGGCLIATATYGSEMSSQVQQLRELRDNSLLQTQSGISFMSIFNDVYYSFSPIIADYERENPIFKEMVKIAITPMISSLSILNYVNMDSEIEVIGYGISLILLNVGMYFVAPTVIIYKIRNSIKP